MLSSCTESSLSTAAGRFVTPAFEISGDLVSRKAQIRTESTVCRHKHLEVASVHEILLAQKRDMSPDILSASPFAQGVPGHRRESLINSQAEESARPERETS